MEFVDLLANDNYIIANKSIANIYGLDEAIILGELASEYKYWARQNGLTNDGYFYSTIDNVRENTTLSEKRQRNALKALQNANMLDVKLKGQPAKRHIKLNMEQLAAILLNKNSQNGAPSYAEMAEQAPPNWRTNNNNINNNKNNNNKNIYNAVIAHLNAKANTAYKATSKATQQHINARVAEGYTLDDFKTVINKKCAEWVGTEFEKFLRPATLFGTKFENYLNAPEAKRSTYGANGIKINTDIKDDLDEIF